MLRCFQLVSSSVRSTENLNPSHESFVMLFVFVCRYCKTSHLSCPAHSLSLCIRGMHAMVLSNGVLTTSLDRAHNTTANSPVSAGQSENKLAVSGGEFVTEGITDRVF